MNRNATARSIAAIATWTLLLPLFFWAAPNRLLAGDRPNVVFILADDLGWRDLGNEGSTFYESPNIDRIAKGGAKFTRGYAACQVCSPSRAAILTGKFPARVGITDWIGASHGKQWKRNTKLLPAPNAEQLPSSEITLAEAFRDQGYRTFFAGKWHLGGTGSLPTDHGFQINVGGTHRGSPPGGFFSPWNNPNLPDGPKGEYLPLRLGRETADFIEANHDDPFFVFLSFYAVHGPIQTTKALWSKYREKAVSQNGPVENRFEIDRTLPVRQVQDHPLYGGLVEGMDQSVGMVLAKLDELGLIENTIVVFTSDNGGVASGDGRATSNLPLRGGKGRQWEGGIREPYYVMWPKSISPGTTFDLPVTGTDFYPTLLELTGQPLLADQHVDGVSLATLLRNPATTSDLDSRNLYWHYPHYGNQGGEPSSIVIQGDWKLIHYYEDGRDELYNIAADVGEQKNLSDDQPQKASELRADLDRWLASVDAKKPIVNPDFDPIAHQKQKRRIREAWMPELEQQHASFLEPDYSPKQGWWEDTGR
jgi:arylsulfatase A-like enzyme